MAKQIVNVTQDTPKPISLDKAKIISVELATLPKPKPNCSSSKVTFDL